MNATWSLPGFVTELGRSSALRVGAVVAVAALAVSVAAVLSGMPRGSAAPSLETVDLSGTTGGPALCPWREPKTDLRRFFPGITDFRTETLVYSSLRPELMRRLGPGVRLQENSMQVYRVGRETESAGMVLVRRVPGEYGAIEIVVAVAPDGRVIGARVQRQREPVVTARALTSPSRLGAFRGKTAGDAWKVGVDLPAVPETAMTSASAVATAVRTLLITRDVVTGAASRK